MGSMHIPPGYGRRTGRGHTPELPEGHFSDNDEIPYTSEDIRFTAKGRMVYAIVMRWPEEGTVIIRSMAKQREQTTMNFHGLIRDVRILGEEKEGLRWRQEEDGLYVECRLYRKFPVVIRVEMI